MNNYIAFILIVSQLGSLGSLEVPVFCDQLLVALIKTSDWIVRGHKDAGHQDVFHPSTQTPPDVGGGHPDSLNQGLFFLRSDELFP